MSLRSDNEPEPPKFIVDAGLSGDIDFGGGGGSGGDGGTGGGDDGDRGWGGGYTPASAKRMIVWLFVATVAAMYLGFAVVYVARLSERAKFDFSPPGLLWVNTVLLVASSVALSWGYKKARKLDNQEALTKALGATFVLGSLFLAGQLLAWRELMSRGLAPSTHFFSGFTYLFTGMHGLHLLSGLAVVGSLWWKSAQGSYRSGRLLPVELGAVYWHFLGGLWVCLFALLLLSGA